MPELQWELDNYARITVRIGQLCPNYSENWTIIQDNYTGQLRNYTRSSRNYCGTCLTLYVLNLKISLASHKYHSRPTDFTRVPLVSSSVSQARKSKFQDISTFLCVLVSLVQVSCVQVLLCPIVSCPGVLVSHLTESVSGSTSVVPLSNGGGPCSLGPGGPPGGLPGGDCQEGRGGGGGGGV